MRTEKRSLFALPGFTILAVLFILSTLPDSMQAQQNAAIQSGSNTSPSLAFFDATTATGTDICAMINNALSLYNAQTSNGVVVDARGIPSTMLTCSSVNPVNPWQSVIVSSNNDSSTAFSNVVLLPSGTITISTSWILPNNTQLVGEGPYLTTIVAASGIGDLIDMGLEGNSGPPSPFCSSEKNPNAPDCPGIVIEHLGLQGNGSGNGIVNCCGQELSEVNDVFITNVGVGLWLSDRYSENSGPYSNLTISNVNTCLKIGPGGSDTPIPNTRGVHGLTCSVNSTTPAIMIDSPNNSLEDISILGNSSLPDGILRLTT